MTVAVPPSAFVAQPAIEDDGWRRQAVALAISVAMLVILFGRDSTDLARIWWTSTTFGHCLFIGPVLGWLVWQRRKDLAALRPVAWAPGLALVAFGGFAWVVGEAAQVALARHLGLVIMGQGLVVTLLGPQVARGLLFPLAYAFFLVPFGESLEAPLQRVTVAMTMPLLHVFGVPAQVDGVLITIPNGYFEVAEACSGAKFVIAMAAYGTLVANVCYVAWGRRIAFMMMAMVVPILANGLRAFGTIYAAHLTSVEAATGMDHIVYGWIFFGLVMAAVLAIGWRWFDRDPDARWFDPATLQAMPRFRIDVSVAAALALMTAAVFPAWASLGSRQTAATPRQIALPVVPGWQLAPLSVRAPWSPHYPGADHFLMGRYVSPRGQAVDLAIAVFADQREGKELVGFGIGALRENDRWIWIAKLGDIDGGAAMRITAPGPVERIVATWYRVGDLVLNNNRDVKLETLKVRMLGGPNRAVAVLVSSEATREINATVAIKDFLKALGPIDRLADTSAGLTR